MRRTPVCSLLPALVVALAACEREERVFREVLPAATAGDAVSLSGLRPGPETVSEERLGPYDENAYAISEGQQYFEAFNCSGCHASGGGGMGPALMDDKWTYGSEPENIFHTIVEGRPNGMPSFRGRISNQQVWQLVAYVRSLGALTPMDTRAGRGDDMQVKPPPSQTRPARPVQSTSP